MFDKYIVVICAFMTICFGVTSITNFLLSINQIPTPPILCTYTGVRQLQNGHLMYVQECLDDNVLVNMTSHLSKCKVEGCISLMFKDCPIVKSSSTVYIEEGNCTNLTVYLFNLFMVFCVGLIVICIGLITIIINKRKTNNTQSATVPESLTFSNPLYNVPKKKESPTLYMEYEADFDIDSMSSIKTEADIGDEE